MKNIFDHLKALVLTGAAPDAIVQAIDDAQSPDRGIEPVQVYSPPADERPVRVITPEIIRGANIVNGMSPDAIDAAIEKVFTDRGE